MTTIVHALTPVYNKVQVKSLHENSLSGPDTTSWPVPIFTPTDPHAITVGHLYNWSEGWADDRGGMIAKRGSVHFDLEPVFARYTKLTGKPAPTSFTIARASLGFMYNSLGINWEVNGEVGGTPRYGSQLSRLFYTTGQAPWSPTNPNPIATVPGFHPIHQKNPATFSTSGIDYLRTEPKSPPPIGRPRIDVPLVFVTKKGGHILEVDDGSTPVDGGYRVDLTGKLPPTKQFGIVLAGSPEGEVTSDPQRSFMDFGAAVYYNFFLNVKIDF